MPCKLPRIDELPYRQHIHRQPRQADRRRTEGSQDDCVRFADEPGKSGAWLSPAGGRAGQEFRLRSGESRYTDYRASLKIKPAALFYVDHHDDAYKWAEKRKLETHPKTGAAQLVEIRERVEEIRVPYYVTAEAPPPKPLLFDRIDDDELLGYGVPSEWLADVKGADEDTILELAEHLPEEASEALLEIATGGTPQIKPMTPRTSFSITSTVASRQIKPMTPRISLLITSAVASPHTDPFDHPDAQRRFRAVSDVEELERALDFPWEKWTIFLHPAQRELVEKDFKGPARVSGSAGTGKTIVALHRAVFLARRNPESRVLLTTFSDSLANALREKLKRLIGGAPRLAERLEIHSLDAIALRLYKFNADGKTLLKREQLFELVSRHADGIDGLRFSKAFVFEEWLQVVDAWQIDSWEEYRDVRRLGRKTRLTEPQRRLLWGLFEQVQQELKTKNLVSMAGIYLALTDALAGKQHGPFDFAVVDEAQDISIPQLRFLSVLGGDRPNALFFAGDLGQRIFQQAFSWQSLGVDIRGRARTLRVNYRTSHQIRMQADRLYRMWTEIQTAAAALSRSLTGLHRPSETSLHAKMRLTMWPNG